MRNSEHGILSFKPSKAKVITNDFWLVSMCILFIWTGIPIIYLVWKYLQDFKCQKYLLTNQRLIIKKGVIVSRDNELELYRIDDYGLRRGLLYKLIDICITSLKFQPLLLGDILVISTDRTHPLLWINGISNATEIKERIRIAGNDDDRVRRIKN